MKKVSLDYVKKFVTAKHKQDYLNKAVDFYEFTVDRPEAIAKLVVPFHPRLNRLVSSRWFGLVKQTATVEHIIQNLFKQNLSFKDFTDPHTSFTKDPQWFSRMDPLLENFMYEKADPILVTSLSNQEYRENPDGLFRLLDGQHRALALTYLLQTNQIHYQPISLILMVRERVMTFFR